MSIALKFMSLMVSIRGFELRNLEIPRFFTAFTKFPFKVSSVFYVILQFHFFLSGAVSCLIKSLPEKLFLQNILFSAN